MLGKHGFILGASLLLLLAGAGAAAAQDTGRIEGRITRPDGAGLAGVSIRIDQLDEVVLTDEAGAFAFAAVPAGTYDLTFRLIDHSMVEKGVAVAAGATRTLDKTVDWDVSFAEAITVTSVSRRAERITEAPAAVTVVSEQEIAQEAAAGQVPKLLEFSPGVDFTQSGLYDFNFNTRGFNSSLNRRVLTLIDGRDPAVPFLGAQEWAAVSVPDGRAVERRAGARPGLRPLRRQRLRRRPQHDDQGAARHRGRPDPGHRRRALHPPRRLPLGLRSGGGFYGKLVGGYAKSDDYTLSRNQAVEYSRFCPPTGGQDCLRREAVPLAKDEAKIGFGGLRLDKYFSESAVLTLEAGTADLEGPTFLTGIGRVQVTDTKRPWGRFNFNVPHWNVLAYYDTRKAKKQVALASGANLYEDSSNLHGEIQGNFSFARDKAFVVGGVAYHEQDIDTANPAGFQTLMTEAHKEHQEAIFGQLQYSFSDRFKTVVAARVNDSTLHDTQFSPKASLVYSFTPNRRFA